MRGCNAQAALPVAAMCTRYPANSRAVASVRPTTTSSSTTMIVAALAGFSLGDVAGIGRSIKSLAV